jgi:predicted dithiol-disulfide oxidoreductase (DUF899 family)
MPEVTDRATWQAQLDELLVREKGHTREGDSIAVARRRLPMVEVDPSIPVTGEHGQVPLAEVFEGRRQLIVYYHMWDTGKPAQDQCSGCTFCNGQVSDLSYLHSRDVTFATFSEGPYEESARYREFMGYPMPWYSVEPSSDALVAGRGPGMIVCYLRDGERVFETYWATGRATEAMGCVRPAGHDRVRPSGDLRGFPAGLASVLAEHRRAVAHQRAPHSAVGAARGRDLR